MDGIFYAKWSIMPISNATFETGVYYVLTSRNGSGGYDLRTNATITGTTLKMTAMGTTAGGADTSYWHQAHYKLEGVTFVGQGQSIQISTRSTLNSGAGSVSLYANTTALGTVSNNTGVDTVFSFTLPNDGATYSLYFYGYQHSNAGYTSTFNFIINTLQIVE